MIPFAMLIIDPIVNVELTFAGLLLLYHFILEYYDHQ